MRGKKARRIRKEFGVKHVRLARRGGDAYQEYLRRRRAALAK